MPKAEKTTLKSADSEEEVIAPLPVASEPPPLQNPVQVPTIKSVKLIGSVFGYNKLSVTQGFTFDWDGVNLWLFASKGGARELIPFSACVSIRVQGQEDEEG